MATWQDGPEYAPLERPTAFVESPAAPLETPARPGNLATGAPAEQPVFNAPGGPAPALDALVPAVADPRDPYQAFKVTSSTITGPSAWAAAHSTPTSMTTLTPWTPEQPVFTPAPVAGHVASRPVVQSQTQVNPAPFPAPGTPEWFAPPPQWARVPDGPPSVTLGQMVAATTPGVLVPLLVGALFSWLSLVMLAASFALSGRIAYRRDTVRRLYSGAAVVLALAGGTAMLDATLAPELLWESVSGWAQLICWVLPVVLVLVVGSALRAGERPERIL